MFLPPAHTHSQSRSSHPFHHNHNHDLSAVNLTQLAHPSLSWPNFYPSNLKCIKLTFASNPIMKNVKARTRRSENRLSEAAVTNLVRKRNHIEQRAKNLRRSLREKENIPDENSRQSDSEGEPTLPDLPADETPIPTSETIVVSDGPIRSRPKIHRHWQSFQNSTPHPSSDSSMIQPSSVTTTTNSVVTLTHSRVQHSNRGLASIRNPNLHTLAQIVARRVGRSIVFDNAFPTDDDFDRMFREQWNIAEKEAGFKQFRTKVVDRVVSTIFCVVMMT